MYCTEYHALVVGENIWLEAVQHVLREVVNVGSFGVAAWRVGPFDAAVFEVGLRTLEVQRPSNSVGLQNNVDRGVYWRVVEL